ncbi:MAG: Gfo/Idh/MocA family oxidoreductase [Pseudomonadota bacterium]
MAYQVLIIGCGAIAGGYDHDRSPEDWPLSHAGAIARDTRFALAACVDPDHAARGAFVDRWTVPNWAGSLDGLDAEPGEYDLIVIASPTECHAEHLEWALGQRPKAILCEKPLAKGYEPAFRLFHEAAQLKIPLAINYTRRWQPDINDLVERARYGEEWGELLSAVGTYSKGIVHNGSHMVDLMMMFAGPLEVHSVGPAVIDQWEDDPTVSAILTAKDRGQPLHLVGSDSRAVTQFELVLNYEFGEIAIRDGGMRIEIRRAAEDPVTAGYRRLGAPISAPGRYPEAMSAAYDNMAGVIARKAHPKWGDYNGISAQAICEQIRLIALETLTKDTPE